ncbi:piggyBac transposable element-derived protein 4-like [Procambarus clarkii]|uniref:piggyBac transposable element-derived protein 4-like n=1 Tax=Procambarus clarkii TaxID=6728 RepID=UPI0037438EC1
MITKPTNALGYIQLFITRALIHYLAYETNLYALQIFNLAKENVDDIWKPVKLKEMARFLGLCMLMGVTKNPTMRMYWQTNKPWHTRFFNMFMTSRRFQHIGQFFHAFNSNAVSVDNTDKLIKVRPVMDYLRHRFQEVYYPIRELCLDEGTMAWRGRLSFKVYNPSKPDKYGVKFYMLAESTSGYIYSFEVYSGIGRTIIETVTGLMRPLLNKGHHLYMDNYYNSVTLTEKLREVGVYTCGTIRLLRGGPKDLQQIAKSKIDVDTTIYRRKDNTFILLWKDKRVVSMITNLHNADTKKVQKSKQVRRPDGRMSVMSESFSSSSCLWSTVIRFFCLFGLIVHVDPEYLGNGIIYDTLCPAISEHIFLFAIKGNDESLQIRRTWPTLAELWKFIPRPRGAGMVSVNL